MFSTNKRLEMLLSQPGDDIKFEPYYLKDKSSDVRKPQTFRSHVRNSSITDGFLSAKASYEDITLTSGRFSKNHLAGNAEEYVLKLQNHRMMNSMSKIPSHMNESRDSGNNDFIGIAPIRHSDLIIKENIECTDSLT